MLEIGAPTAQAVLEIIEADPDVHYQGDWQATACQWAMAGKAADSCRTTRCVAGWALFLHGHSEDQIHLLAGLRGMYGGAKPIIRAAATLLGISIADANSLFYSGNKAAVEALRWIALGKKLDWPTIHRNVAT